MSSSSPLQSIQDQINTIQNTYPGILDDYKNYYVLYNSNPNNTEYKNYYDNVNFQLNNLINSIQDTSTQIQVSTDKLNANFQSIDDKITQEKIVNGLLQNEYGNVESKLQGTTELVNEYTTLYNRQYRKNILLGISIVAISYSLYRLNNITTTF